MNQAASNWNIESPLARSKLLTNWSNNDPNSTIQLDHERRENYRRTSETFFWPNLHHSVLSCKITQSQRSCLRGPMKPNFYYNCSISITCPSLTLLSTVNRWKQQAAQTAGSSTKKRKLGSVTGVIGLGMMCYAFPSQKKDGPCITLHSASHPQGWVETTTRLQDGMLLEKEPC